MNNVSVKNLTPNLVSDIKAVTKPTDAKGLKCVSDTVPVTVQTQYLAIGPVSDIVRGTWRKRQPHDLTHFSKSHQQRNISHFFEILESPRATRNLPHATRHLAAFRDACTAPCD